LNALSTLERRHLKEGFVMLRRIQDRIRAWCSWEIVGW
jgi:hypothetical protein